VLVRVVISFRSVSVASELQSREDVYRGRKQGCTAYTAKKVAEFEMSMSMSMREYSAGFPARIASGIRAGLAVVFVVGQRRVSDASLFDVAIAFEY